MKYIVTMSGAVVPIVYAQKMGNGMIFWTPNRKKASEFGKIRARQVAAEARHSGTNVQVVEVKKEN